MEFEAPKASHGHSPEVGCGTGTPDRLRQEQVPKAKIRYQLAENTASDKICGLMTVHNRLLMFDFDGVIVDSYDAAFAAAIKQVPTLTEERYKGFFMGNVYREATKQTGIDTVPHVDDPFFQTYIPLLMKSEPTPGIRGALEILSKHFHCVVVSSTINSPIEEYLKKHDMMHFFELVYGADVHKLKTEKIKMAMKKFGLPHSSCLFVTDTVGDIREATRVDVQSVAVSWGFHDREDLLAEEPVAVVDSVSALLSEIHRVFEIEQA